MNRTKKFLSNAGSTAVLQVVTMISGLVIPRIMLQYYGSEINGLVTSITQFIYYFTLVEAGLSAAAVFALYEPLANKDHTSINQIVTAAKKFYLQAGYIFLGLVVAFSVFYPLYIKIPGLSLYYIAGLVLVIGVNGALEFFTLAKYRVLLTADQRTYLISIASIVQIVTNTVIIVICAQFLDVLVLRIVVVISIFIRTAIILMYVKSKYKYVNFKAETTQRLDKRWDALYQQILGVAQMGSAVIIITLVLKDLKVVSVYTIYNMVAIGVSGVLSIFVSGLAASFGDVIARNQKDILQKAYKEFEFSYYSLLTVVYAVMFVTITSFINVYTFGITDANYNLPVIGFLITLNGLFFNLKTPQGMLVMSAGLYKETRWRSSTQALIIIAGSTALAFFFGLEGVLIGAILSNIYRCIDLLFFIPKHVTSLPVKDTLQNWILVLFELLIITVPFMFIRINVLNYIDWALFAVSATLYAMLVVIVVGFIIKRSMMKALFHRLRGLRRKDEY